MELAILMLPELAKSRLHHSDCRGGLCIVRAGGSLRSPSVSFVRDDAGTMIVEFALSALIGLTLMLGIIEVSSLLYTYNVIGNAARDGLRYAVIHGTDSGLCSGPSSGCADSTGANIVTVVQNTAQYSFHDVSRLSVTPSWPDSSSAPGSRVKVQVTYTYVPYVHIAGLSPQISTVSEGRIVF